jgi:protein O-GlcNAc transferase
MAKLTRLDPKALEHAVAAYRAGKLMDATGFLRRIVAHTPSHADANYLLGLIAFAARDPLEAHARFAVACQGQPQNAGFRSNLAEAARRLGRLDEAIAHFERALADDELQVEARFNLGLAHAARGELERARHCFELASALRPDDARLAQRLARAHYELGELDQAQDTLQRLIAASPDTASVHASLGTVLFQLGEHTRARACLRRALELEPSAAVHSALLFQLMFAGEIDAHAIREEAERFGASFARRDLRLPDAQRARTLDPQRRLRIGYVSADFREHVTANVVLPLLRHHSRDAFEVHCYASQTEFDALSDEFRSLAQRFRDITQLSDDAAAELIASDQIDILVDLSMHLAGNRLGVFARKPAPLQLCWFAYPGTTGVGSIDYRFSDPVLDPPDSGDEQYSERTWRLPDSFWCWEPLLPELEPGPPPLLACGLPTFGSLNNFCKVSEPCLATWAHVLRALPEARFMLMAPPGRARARLAERFERLGISASRLKFVAHQPRRAYFELYREIDVCLDTLPYNGHTTSLDALWMGVPVLTLVGERVVGRAGLCQARSLDLPELVATTPEELAARAAALVRDPSRLIDLRASLRARLARSPLMDGSRFARNFEDGCRAIWRRWCSETASTSG